MQWLLRRLMVLAGLVAVVGTVFLLLAAFWPMPGMVAEAIRHYLFDLNQPVLINHPALTQGEERHLLDVKQVIRRLELVTLMGAGVMLAGLLVLPARTVLLRALGKAGLAVLVLLGLGVLVLGFRQGFVSLHVLLFPAGSWWFASDSTLISLFPLVFFQQFALCYAGSLLLVFVGCWWGASTMFRSATRSTSSS